jgi:hypothetical protein
MGSVEKHPRLFLSPKEHEELKKANKKFWMLIFNALYIPQLTKWLDNKLKRWLKIKRCETCEYWIKNYITSTGELFDEDDPSKTEYDEETKYGRCKEAIFLNDSSAEEELDIDDLAAKGKKMFVEDGEGYFAALFTHKDHRCKCWQGK